MKPWLAVTFFLFMKCPSLAQPDESAAVVLPPVVVHGERPVAEDANEQKKAQSSNEETKPIFITSGTGAKTIDAPTNLLGVSLASIANEANDEDISLLRRNQSWILNSSPKRDLPSWVSQTQWVAGEESFIKAKLHSKSEKQKSVFEFGLLKDRRSVNFRESNGGSLAALPGIEKQYRQRSDQGYLQILKQEEAFTSLWEGDFQIKDVYISHEMTGVKKVNQLGLNLKWTQERARWLSFLQAKQSDFQTRKLSLYSTETKGIKTGILYEKPGLIDGDLLQVGLTQETLFRHQDDPISADEFKTQFQRQSLNFLVSQKIEFSPFESRVHLKTETLRDEMKTRAFLQSEGLTPASPPSATRSMMEPLAWDVGVEISTSSKNTQGLLARARRFGLPPTPTQRFGDGALLQGSLNLPSSTGVRTSVGSWWDLSFGHFELSPFFEQTQNEPVVVAVSPNSAQTMAIGSVIAKGIEFKGTAESRSFKFFKLEFQYSFQEALNNSSIQWQRGRSIPGRPKHTLQTDFQIQKPRGQSRSWKYGLSYGFQSADALDLSGMWFKSPHHDLNGFFAYGTKAWEVRLSGLKLLANLNELPRTLTAGQAGVDLLEPAIEQTEFKLLCEFIL